MSINDIASVLKTHREYAEQAYREHFSTVTYNASTYDWHIHTVRIAKVQLNEDKSTGETNAIAYDIHDEIPFDVYGLYCSDKDGFEWHLCDYKSYPEACYAMEQCLARIRRKGGGVRPVYYSELLRLLS